MHRSFTIALAFLILAAPSPADAGKELINESAGDGEEILVSDSAQRIPGQPVPSF
jgi:hypothetical protein